jgi:hypothetical protein
MVARLSSAVNLLPTGMFMLLVKHLVVRATLPPTT